ncbi:MAG: hypothetical protein JSW10_12955, partial [Pseudomonadota bacterium]
INVAESRAKKTVESPMIAKAVLQAINDLSHSKRPVESFQQTLVLGYGSIGEAIVGELTAIKKINDQTIWIHDVDPLRLEAGKARGINCWGDRRSEKADLVIGCSGNVSFIPEDVGWLADGALIVSAGSGSIEVSRDLFLQGKHGVKLQHNAIGSDLIPVKDMHADLRFKTDDVQFTIANGGFPVNFDGRKTDRIPLRDIQVTAALMVNGALQAVETGHTGLLEVDEVFENWLIKTMSRQGGETVPKQQSKRPPLSRNK